MTILSTRLRFISAASPEDAVGAVERLPFRVELKQIVQNSNGHWVVFFVIPDEIPEFQSVALEG